jgi:hypothetical protein
MRTPSKQTKRGAKPLSHNASLALRLLTSGLRRDATDRVRVGSADVTVEALTHNIFIVARQVKIGAAEYADPAITVWRSPTGRFYAIHFASDVQGIYEDGVDRSVEPARVLPEQQHALTSVVDEWLCSLRQFIRSATEARAQ